jgi:hypothetical protein
MKPTQFKLIIPAIWILILVLCISSSCSCNQLKTDEKKLVNQILTEEEKLAQQEVRHVEREKQLADSVSDLDDILMIVQ